MIQQARLVLASQSRARAAVMAAAGLDFAAVPTRVDEAEVKVACREEGLDAIETALTLARMKAARVRDKDAIVIGADQMLVCEGVWFDKPADLEAARVQLAALRGRTHQLVTAVVCWRGLTEIWAHVATPVLRMRPFSDAVRDAYVAAEGEALLGCVGAYRIEGLGIHLFEAIEGEHAAILGLPLLPLLGFLRQHRALAL